MTANHSKLNRSHFFETISSITMVPSAKVAKLDFWGSVALVCSIGVVAHFIHALLLG